MALHSKLLSVALSCAVLIISDIDYAVSDPVTWNIVETACSSFNGGCKSPLPLTVGSITGDGTYLNGILQNVSETGDFLLKVGDQTFTATSGPICPFNYAGASCSVNINLTTTSSGVTGYDFSIFNGASEINNLAFFGTTFGGNLGSLGPEMPGCEFAYCAVSGELVRVPEPSPLAVFAGALFGFGLIRLRRTKACRGRAQSDART